MVARSESRTQGLVGIRAARLPSRLFAGRRSDRCGRHAPFPYRDDDIVVGLHELVAAVVQGSHHAGAGGIAETDQAAFGDGNRFRSAGVANAGQITIAVVVLAQVDQRYFKPGYAPAGRVDYQRSAELAFYIGQGRTGIYPEKVVAAQAEILGARRRRSGFRIDGRAGLDVLRGKPAMPCRTRSGWLVRAGDYESVDSWGPFESGVTRGLLGPDAFGVRPGPVLGQRRGRRKRRVQVAEQPSAAYVCHFRSLQGFGIAMVKVMVSRRLGRGSRQPDGKRSIRAHHSPST